MTYNDPALTARITTAIGGVLGPENVVDDPLQMGSEDFGLFGLGGHQIPTVMFWLGAMDPLKFAEASAAGKELPGLHSNHFEPLPEPTLRTGVEAMTAAAIALLQN
ncbi:MAG TPA: hypothetical protein VHC90_14875 [Bryobacteraceae bacterium]|nr:hypothetical protein [Bryobacteraceae bacterium]